MEELTDQAIAYVEIFLVKEKRKIPEAGNPLFKAFHGVNAESKESLRRSHKIKEDQVSDFKEEIADLLVRWIVREYNLREQDVMRKRGLMRFAD